jgi:hypothetical protein
MRIVVAARETRFPDARILDARTRENSPLANPPRDRVPAGLRDLSPRSPPPVASHLVACREPATACSGDPAQLFPEKAPSQVAILLTKSDQGAESAVRCLQEMGIPFFVTRDLRAALRHKLLVLYPEVDGITFDATQARAVTANLEATNPLVMWAYTNLADKRWVFTRKYLTLKQDPNNSEAQKLGMFNPNTWAAYVLNGEAFIKRAQATPGETYPDFGCSFETFTNNQCLEMETVSPMTKLPPGKTAEQVEHWSLHRNVKLTDLTDDAIDAVILPLLRAGANAN